MDILGWGEGVDAKSYIHRAVVMPVPCWASVPTTGYGYTWWSVHPSSISKSSSLKNEIQNPIELAREVCDCEVKYCLSCVEIQ